MPRVSFAAAAAVAALRVQVVVVPNSIVVDSTLTIIRMQFKHSLENIVIELVS